MKRLLRALLVPTAIASTFVVATASPANAAARDGKCQSGEFCYYYNTGYAGSISDFTSSVSDLGSTQPSCYEFKGAGAGKGKCTKNQAASVWNRTSKSVTVFYNSGYAGRSMTIKAGAKANLATGGLKNNNAGHRIGAPPAASTAWASPVPSSAVITARAYYSSGRYHGAVDYAGFSGRFKSACTGSIDKIAINPTYANRNAYGVSGSTNYLWVNCGGGVRMGYAHFYQRDLPSTLKVGTKVKAGQALVNVGNQGNSSGTHLHFEVQVNGSKVDGHNFLKGKGVTGLPKG